MLLLPVLDVEVRGEARDRPSLELDDRDDAVGRAGLERRAVDRCSPERQPPAPGRDAARGPEEGGEDRQRVDADVEQRTNRVERRRTRVPRLDPPVVHLGVHERISPALALLDRSRYAACCACPMNVIGAQLSRSPVRSAELDGSASAHRQPRARPASRCGRASRPEARAVTSTWNSNGVRLTTQSTFLSASRSSSVGAASRPIRAQTLSRARGSVRHRNDRHVRVRRERPPMLVTTSPHPIPSLVHP